MQMDATENRSANQAVEFDVEAGPQITLKVMPIKEWISRPVLLPANRLERSDCEVNTLPREMPAAGKDNDVAEDVGAVHVIGHSVSAQTIGNTRSPHWIKYRIEGTRDVSCIALTKEMKDRERDDRRCHKTTHPCPVDEVIGKFGRWRNVPFAHAGVEITKCANWRIRFV